MWDEISNRTQSGFTQNLHSIQEKLNNKEKIQKIIHNHHHHHHHHHHRHEKRRVNHSNRRHVPPNQWYNSHNNNNNNNNNKKNSDKSKLLHDKTLLVLKSHLSGGNLQKETLILSDSKFTHR